MDIGRPAAVLPPPPPPPNGARGQSARRSTAKKTGKQQIRDGLITYFNIGEGLLAATGDVLSAEVWHHGGPQCAEAWADLAMQNEQVNRALTKLVEGGAWGAAVGLSVAMVAPVIAARGTMLPMPVRFALQETGKRLIDEDRLTDRMRAAIKAQEASQAQGANSAR